jgi:hypothetical protein|tara:strand:- start:415 stop:624 length:210 start_codon:yes stop_codon:yes gene_type:complete
MSHKQITLEFKQSLSDTDYGLIVGADGMLKGIWVPEDMDDQDIPQNIVDLCIQKFGIDPNGCGEQVVLQ